MGDPFSRRGGPAERESELASFERLTGQPEAHVPSAFRSMQIVPVEQV